MAIESDIERFLKSPEQLIDLCRAVVQRLMDQRKGKEQINKEAQLREISKAIERLKQLGLPIPAALIDLKTRMAIDAGNCDDPENSLRFLATEFKSLAETCRGYHRKPQPIDPSCPAEKTPKSVLERFLLESLRELGGSARCNDVLDLMEKKLSDRLLPGDIEHDDHHGTIWRHQANWIRLDLVHRGILKSNSLRGYWEIDEDNT